MTLLPINKTSLYQITIGAFSLVILVIACRLMLNGVGASSSFGNVALMALLFIILSATKKTFYFLAIPIVLVYALYSPIGKSFGLPSYGYIAIILSTSASEAREFFSIIPARHFLYPVGIIVLIGLYQWLTNKFHIQLYKNRAVLCVLIIFIFINQNPGLLLKRLYQASYEVYQEVVNLRALSSQDSAWGESTLNANAIYDDYVLIIGESARKDYHHAYGYPIENTPFMSTSPGVLVDGMTSGGKVTVDSLRLMLTKPNTTTWEPNYSLNFISLMKSAGLQTIWISNQGYLGEYDTPITAIANHSDIRLFQNKADFFFQSPSDFDLLPVFEKSLQTEHRGKRLIVLHLYGSHPNPCERLFDYHRLLPIADNNRYSIINCYISSLNKTDDVLKRVYEILQNSHKTSHRTFSMLYFSDHGMGSYIDEKGFYTLFAHHGASMANYEIPLFKITSDDTQRREIHAFKSGLNFTNGLGNWVGIDNPQLDPNLSLFSPASDPDDYGLANKIRGCTRLDY